MSDDKSVKSDEQKGDGSVKSSPKKDDEIRIEFDKEKKFPEDIKEEIRKALLPLIAKAEPTKISKNLAAMLNKKFGEGWNVVTGGHFSGNFTYIEGFYTEAKVKDLVISIFKIYIPQK